MSPTLIWQVRRCVEERFFGASYLPLPPQDRASGSRHNGAASQPPHYSLALPAAPTYPQLLAQARLMRLRLRW